MNDKKKINICHSSILTEQLNDFVNSYAFKYPIYKNSTNSQENPYSLIDINIKDLSAEQKKSVIQLLDEYSITPKYITGADISDEHKTELMLEFLDENRTLFRREEERIIYTEAFRRLQYKTQVMVNSASDEQRTRLLHSLEVQKISRKIAIALKANYELTETIAISHDIGHAPFGHAGEKAIKKYLEKHLVGSFSHALQSVKVIDFLCSHRALKPKGLKGLGVSDLVLEGVLKHDSDSFIDNMSSAEFRLQYDCLNLCKPVGINNTDESLYCNNDVYIGGIESQIVCLADKIAYLGHDWEEFVAVDLLEVMLSRINKIIIQLDDFIGNSTDVKFSHISKDEKCRLFELNENYISLKKVLAKPNYSSDLLEKDEFIENLDRLIKTCKEIVETLSVNSCNFLLFSKEQYETIYAFFKVARCWITITQKKPEILGGKIDAIFIIYKYLNDTTSHRTVPALIKRLIESCSDNVISSNGTEKDRDLLIKDCNTNWQNKKKDLVKKQNNEKNLKSELRKTFAVRFNDEYTEATEYINKFIFQEFIKSTRVKFMTQKAEMIVERLMDFYYKDYKMLPLKHRNRIEFETNCCNNLNKTKELLIEYYKEKIKNAIENDKDNNLEAPSKFSKLKDSIIAKIGTIISDSHTLNLEASPNTVEKVITGLIITDDEFAKDAIILRVIADYVSGMTDRMAEMKYNEICSTGTQWSIEYSDRGTFNF